MKKLITIQTVVVAILVSTSVWADTHGEDQDSASMPMMNPQMMESMMAQDQQHNMPMMNMHMMYKMMHQANAMGQNHGHGHGHDYQQSQGMPMMGGGMGNMMMNPQMIQMRMQHMANMEERLENIESLLSQLVELQKTE